MPTITFELSVDDVRVHRRVAKSVSLWLRGQGVELNHVVTRFVILPIGNVYSGPFPLAGTAAEPLAYAFAHCVVAHDRDAGFCHALAAQITRSLQPEVRADRVFVRFDPIDPARHWTGSEALGLADKKGEPRERQ